MTIPDSTYFHLKLGAFSWQQMSYPSERETRRNPAGLRARCQNLHPHVAITPHSKNTWVTRELNRHFGSNFNPIGVKWCLIWVIILPNSFGQFPLDPLLCQIDPTVFTVHVSKSKQRHPKDHRMELYFAWIHLSALTTCLLNCPECLHLYPQTFTHLGSNVVNLIGAIPSIGEITL